MKRNALPAQRTTSADAPLIATQKADTLPPVLLEQATLSEGIYVIFKDDSTPIRAAYDPKQVNPAVAEAMLRLELGRRHDVPAGLVISVGGSLALAPLPDGEPLRVERQDDSGLHVTLDTAQADLDTVLELLERAHEEKTGARA
ncbi:hypothetical protein GCM10010420_39280 [Streptomyces glaucosporus]|uniref:Uncharacterized protein n=1 Tax=Streptomyces glaucosporus TaxID=284044 RepID=A0ABN3IM77_9ACTN